MTNNFLNGFRTGSLKIEQVNETNKNIACMLYKNLKRFRMYTYKLRTPTFKRVYNKKCLPPGKNPDSFTFFTITRIEDNIAIGLLPLYDGWPNDDTLFIGMFYIDEGYKSMGYGTEVLSALIKKSKTNYNNLMIRVHKTNKHKPEFFLKNGFRSYQRLPMHDEVLINEFHYSINEIH